MTYGGQCRAAGFAAAHSFPRRVRGQNIGALDLLAHLTPAAPSS
ncbi:hypothetical protein [Streptomyces roseolus]